MQSFTGEAAARRREMVHTAILVGLDASAMFIAFEVARLVRSRSDRPFAHMIGAWRFTGLMLATIPLWAVIFALCGLYAVRSDKGRVSEVGRVIAAVVGGVMLLISFDYFSYNLQIFPSRSVPLIALAVGIVVVIAERQLARWAMRQFFRRGRGLHNVIVIGTGDVARRIAVQLSNASNGYRLVAAVDAAAAGSTIDGVPTFASVSEAMSRQPEHRIDEIIQADLELSRAETVRQMAFANSAGITYRFVPDRYGVYAAASTMGTVGGVPLMEVRLTSLDGWGAVGKRIFDVVGAIALLLLLLPVMVVVALAVKLTDPHGPVLYTQQRLGLNGAPIGVKKFRSMTWRYSTGPGRPFATAPEAFAAMGRHDLLAEFTLFYKVNDDPRISWIGRLLRKTSLDELPQLFNALMGDLSLVGPRPITQDELDRYGERATSFLALKPGITGLWQVYGRSTTTYEERVKLDLYYVENWSIGMDVSILARTLVTVAARKGAV